MPKPTRIRRTAAVLLTALALSGALIGCSDQTSEANSAISSANAQVIRYTAAGTQLDSLMTEARSLSMTSSADASRGVELTDRMTATLDIQRAAATAAAASLDSVADMKVPDELKTYAVKEASVARALVREDAAARSLVSEMRTLYAAVGAGTSTAKGVEAASVRIAQGAQQLAELDAAVERLEKDATAYYDAHGLAGGR
jgi:hypothetical protein